ncbi:hypothetical protein AMTRI_Chr03g51530 [Amborella trichopoda]
MLILSAATPVVYGLNSRSRFSTLFYSFNTSFHSLSLSSSLLSLSIQSGARPSPCLVFSALTSSSRLRSKVRAMEELIDNKNTGERACNAGASSTKSSAVLSPDFSATEAGFLHVQSEEDMLLRIKKEKEANRLPENVAAVMEELYHNYRDAVFQSGNSRAHEIVLTNMASAFDLILLDIEKPFTFPPFHKAIREPFDYYAFGQNYIRPLIDFRESYVGNISLFSDVEEKIKQGHNIVFMSNHQTEADPAVIALLLEISNPFLSENLTYLAGDRVVTDPVCKPFSMGRNLICVYSKKHMHDVPELAEMKRRANTSSLKEMALRLRSGSQIIWIAPSGGRDRPDPRTGEWSPAPFDVTSVDNMRRLVEHSGVPGHIYPMAVLCYDIMPPPRVVEKEIGERREISFHGVGISLGQEMNFNDITSGIEDSEEAKSAFSKALYDSVTEQYRVLQSAIHGKKGTSASSSNITLSQPGN